MIVNVIERKPTQLKVGDVVKTDSITSIVIEVRNENYSKYGLVCLNSGVMFHKTFDNLGQLYNYYLADVNYTIYSNKNVKLTLCE